MQFSSKSNKLLWLILGSALGITLLLGLPRLNMMSRLAELNLAEFETRDYVRRLLITFVTANLFLCLNLLVSNFRLKGYTIDFGKISHLIFINLLFFLPLQYLVLTRLAWRIEQEVSQSTGAFYWWTIAINASLVLVCMLIGVVYRYVRENHKIQLTNEALQRETTEARFAQLREQVNPHFMFNAFATLEGLIDESPERSKKFLANMSELYRYVLHQEHQHTVTLAEELRCAQVYSELVAERFGQGVRIQIEIETPRSYRRILPMALQTLLENAVKHNGFDGSNPLIINIKQSDNFIEVYNNLIPRTSAKNSESIGLYNLNQRYRHVSNQEIVITKTATAFCVQLPLIT